MSEENVELLRRAYESFNAIGRTDPHDVDLEQLVPDLWARLDPDVELHERHDLPDAKVYRGREESRKFWRKTWELFSEIHWEPQEVIDGGEVVVLMTHITAVGRASDVPVEMDESNLWWFREGQIVRIEGFGTKQEALAAAGIEPGSHAP